MGNQLSGGSGAAAAAQALPVELHLQDFAGFRYASSTSTRLMKVAKVRYYEQSERETEGSVVVAKVYVVQDPSLPLKPYRDSVEEIQAALRNAPNCCPFEQVLVSEKCAVLLRQFGKDTLYDRLSTRPFLSMVEKRWIAFQLLKALDQCAAASVCHGDIKAENVLVSSWGWAQLADFASYKPASLPADNPADFAFFFDTSRRRACYVAPERFHAGAAAGPGLEAQVAGSNSAASATSTSTLVLLPEERCSAGQLTPAMDVFSMGCVFAELFTDGATPFDFAQMLAFRDGSYTPQLVLDKIECAHIKELVSHMLQRDPCRRWTAAQYLAWQRGKAFPEVFYAFLNGYCQQFVSLPLKSFEQRVATLRDTMPSVLANLGDGGAHPALVIVLTLVTSLLRWRKLPVRAKMDAFALVGQLCRRLRNEVVLERVLPYVLTMTTDPLERVRAAAVRLLADCLESVDVVGQSDYHVFSEYVFPRLGRLVHDERSRVRMSVAENIARLATSAQRFVEYASKHFEADPQVLQAGLDDSFLQFDSAAEMRALREGVQEAVVTLLCDADNAVRRQLIGSSLAELAAFFGREKASDVLLSHMITFLNDKSDWELRAAFYDFVAPLAGYTGNARVLVSSTNILQPLMVQGLRDPEETVVRKTFACLAQLAKSSALSKSVVSDFVGAPYRVAAFLAHPNDWVRAACASFLCNATQQLSIAEVHCKLMPSINRYLRQPLIKIDKVAVLLQTLREPIPRHLFDMVTRSPQLPALLDLFAQRHLERELRSRPPMLGLSSQSASTTSRVALPEDPQLAPLYQRLLNHGLSDEVEEQLYDLSETLLKMTKLRRSLSSSDLSPTDPRRPGVVDATTLRPSQRFFSDLGGGTQRPGGVGGGAGSGPGFGPGFGPGSGPGSTLLNADWQQMFGPSAALAGLASGPGQNQARPGDGVAGADAAETDADPAEEALAISRGTSVVEEQPQPPTAGANEEQLDSAQSAFELGFESAASADDFVSAFRPEALEEAASDSLGHLSECRRAFHELVEHKRNEYRRAARPCATRVRPALTHPPLGWRPSGRNLVHLHEHRAAVSRLAVHPSQFLFASCSHDGSVRLWDAQRMEGGRSMPIRSRWSYSRQGGRLRSVAFGHDGENVICASDNGTVQVIRTDQPPSNVAADAAVVGSLLLPLDGPDGPPVVAEAFFDGVADFVVCLAHHGSLLGWDTRMAAPAWRLLNPYEKGLATAMCLDRVGENWLCVGTDLGHLVTWDLRFQLPINAFQHPSRRRIERLWTHPLEPSVVVCSVQGNGEVALWDLETGGRHLALWPCEMPVLAYKETKGLSTLAACWYAAGGEPFALTGDSSGAIHLWDLTSAKDCHLLSQAPAGGVERTFFYKSALVDGVRVLQGHASPVRRMGLGGLGLVGGSDGDVPPAAERAPSSAHHDAISDLVLVRSSPAGSSSQQQPASQFFVVSASCDGVIKLWK